MAGEEGVKEPSSKKIEISLSMKDKLIIHGLFLDKVRRQLEEEAQSFVRLNLSGFQFGENWTAKEYARYVTLVGKYAQRTAKQFEKSACDAVAALNTAMKKEELNER